MKKEKPKKQIDRNYDILWSFTGESKKLITKAHESKKKPGARKSRRQSKEDLKKKNTDEE